VKFDPFPLIGAVLANLADAAPKLAYADYLDEHGLPNRAAFVRWLGRTGRYPHGCSVAGLYFFTEHNNYNSHLRQCTLPPAWDKWSQQARTPEGPISFTSWDALEKHFAAAWQYLTAEPAWYRRAVGAKRWVPDYSPLPPFNAEQYRLERYLEGAK
jgi:uncharacterized protein (TIGR02996 family)